MNKNEGNVRHDGNAGLFSFLDASPVPFFAVYNMEEQLRAAGFAELLEGRPWMLVPGGAYFVSRNDSALIAFRIPKVKYRGFMIMASHCDSPLFKVKPNPEMTVEDVFVRLNTEPYGGMIYASWLDRPLSIAGRLLVETAQGVETRLCNIDRDLLMIPNLAIHMNREVNDGYKYNPQADLLPLYAGSKDAPKVLELAAQAAGVAPEQVLDADLFVYNRMKAFSFGAEDELIGSGRMDNLLSVYASLQGILAAEPKESIAVHCVFDNEEVGSGSKQGAGGTFLKEVLERIHAALAEQGLTESSLVDSYANSLMVSADAAHSIHPNHPEKADPTNRPYLNKGIVIKYNSNQKYTTDAVSGALFRAICKKAGVPVQTFVNRSDMRGGSTLGNISQGQVSMNTVDVGVPLLAMHSACETAGAKDTEYLAKAARVLFRTSIEMEENGTYRIQM